MGLQYITVIQYCQGSCPRDKPDKRGTKVWNKSEKEWNTDDTDDADFRGFFNTDSNSPILQSIRSINSKAAMLRSHLRHPVTKCPGYATSIFNCNVAPPLALHDYSVSRCIINSSLRTLPGTI